MRQFDSARKIRLALKNRLCSNPFAHERDQPMKIESKSFRVREGEKVKLEKWPTRVKPFYKSKEHYQKLLEARTREMSARQGLFYAHDRYALLLIFQAMDAAGKDGAIRHRSEEQT